MTCHLEDYIDGRGGFVACPECRPWKSPGWVLVSHIEWAYEGGKERYEVSVDRAKTSKL
jgi:hypothetical protein